jgi:hypothetical protein
MRRISTFVLAVAVVLLAATVVDADNTTTATIKFDTGQPTSPAAGKISATGTYTVATGDSILSIKFQACIKGGGSGLQTPATDEGKGNWSANLTGLPGGTYTVTAFITTMKSPTSCFVISDGLVVKDPGAGNG